MDKLLELKLFRYIYGHSNDWDVMPSESPDFICIRNHKPILGVEVTELYRNESDARLKNINGYAATLLKGGNYVHKDDKGNIRVDRVKYIKKDEKDGREINAIIQEVPGFNEKIALLIKAIEGKKKNVDSYLRLCPEVDLIINDASRIFRFDKFENFFIPFSRLIKTSTIISSQFREIFLITSNKERLTVKIPLKLNLFAQDINIFEKLVLNSIALKETDKNQAFKILFYCLYKSGYKDISVTTIDGCIGLSIGSHQYLYSKKSKNIRDCSRIPEQLPKGQFIDKLINKLGESEKYNAKKILKERSNYNCRLELFFEVEKN